MIKIIFSANDIQDMAVEKAGASVKGLVPNEGGKYITLSSHWEHPESGFDQYRSQLIINVIETEISDVS